MKKLKIKSGDLVIVTTGDHKGQEGTVQKVLRDKNKAIVEGINLVKKHQKPSAANPQGGVSEKEAPIHLSNLAIKDPKSGKQTRVGFKLEGDKKVRFAKKSNQVL